MDLRGCLNGELFYASGMQSARVHSEDESATVERPLVVISTEATSKVAAI